MLIVLHRPATTERTHSIELPAALDVRLSQAAYSWKIIIVLAIISRPNSHCPSINILPRGNLGPRRASGAPNLLAIVVILGQMLNV